MAEDKLGGIVWLFVIAVVGIALLSYVADTVWDTSNTYTVTNNSVDVSSGRGTDATGNFSSGVALSLADDYIVSVIGVRTDNLTGEQSLTDGTDFFLNKTEGTFTMLDTAKTADFTAGNFTEWNYTHGDNYVDDGTSRTLLGLIPLFFVIGLVILVLAIVWKKYLQDII